MNTNESKKIMSGKKKPAGVVSQYLDRCEELSGAEEFHQIMGEASGSYIAGDLSIEQLHTRYPKIPAAVFRGYVKDMGWNKLRDENLRAVHVATALDYMSFIHQNRKHVSAKFVENFLPTLDGFKTRLDTALEHGSTTDIRRLTESLKYIMDVLNTTVAINGAIPELPSDIASLMDQMADRPLPLFDITMTGPVTVKNNAPHEEAEAIEHLNKVREIDERD